MRTILLAAAVVVAASVLDVGAAQARQYAYCLKMGPGPGNCAYSTYAQCQASASGTGYYCQRNYALRGSYARYGRLAGARLRILTSARLTLRPDVPRLLMKSHAPRNFVSTARAAHV